MLIDQFSNFALNHRKKLLFLTFTFLTIALSDAPPEYTNV